MTVRLYLQTMVAAPIETVFDLALDLDLHLASMAASRERAVAGVTSGRIGAGEQVTWRAVHFGIPFTMTVQIADLERPRRFVDRQMRGPFHTYEHVHLFHPTAAGTLMTDRIRFDAPLRRLGRLAEWTVLERYLRSLIARRNQYLQTEAERGSGAR